MQLRPELISIGKLDIVTSPRGLIFTFERRLSKALKAKSQEGRISLRFNRMCARLGEFKVKTLTVLLPQFSRLFCLLSSRILPLPNNLLDFYLVEIRRYKVSFFAKPAKPATKSFPTGPPFLPDLNENMVT